MNNKVFIFDLDETLKYTKQDYYLALTCFFNIIYTHSKLRFLAPDIKNLVNEFDKENRLILRVNRGKSSCPTALLNVYKKLCQKNNLIEEPCIQNNILSIEQVIFNEENYKGSLIPGSESVLKLLAQKKDAAYLLTRGNEQEQNKKIDVLEIRKYFKDVIVVPNDKYPVFKQISEEKQDKNRIYSIGDSIDADINPATACGLNAIYIIPSNSSLNYDVSKIQHPERVKKINSIEEIIEKYEEL